MRKLAKNLEGKDLAIGSMDVKALYSSLNIGTAAKVVAEKIVKSEIEYAGADMSVAGAYLASVMIREKHTKEVIAKLLP